MCDAGVDVHVLSACTQGVVAGVRHAPHRCTIPRRLLPSARVNDRVCAFEWTESPSDAFLAPCERAKTGPVAKFFWLWLRRRKWSRGLAQGPLRTTFCLPCEADDKTSPILRRADETGTSFIAASASRTRGESADSRENPDRMRLLEASACSVCVAATSTFR
jgi:hypothetical protein